jgi:hypothetical protein
MSLTLILASVLQMFYTASTNTIALTSLYIAKVTHSGITPNGSHSEVRDYAGNHGIRHKYKGFSPKLIQEKNYKIVRFKPF